jgi:hypothetical protein
MATSDERLVLVSPISINVRAYACAAELKRAGQLAKAWIDSLTKARDAVAAARAADPRSAKANGDLWPSANRAVASAGESAVLLRQALLRALVRSESAPLSRALAALVDQTVVPTLESSRAFTPAAAPAAPRGVENALVERLNTVLGRSKDLALKVNGLLQGEMASLAAAEDEDQRALAALPAPADGPHRALRARAMSDARRMLDDLLREPSLAGVAPAASPSLQGQLRQRIDAQRGPMDAIKPIDFAAAAAEWRQRLSQPAGPGVGGGGPGFLAGPELPARLAAAAQAEALRPDGDPQLACDLQLASRAAAALAQNLAAAREAERAHPKGNARAAAVAALAPFEAAISQLLRDWQHSDDTRAKMRAWAGIADPLAEPTEDLALEASAAWARRDFALADKLDARLVKEIGRASQDESLRFQEDMRRLRHEARELDALAARQQELLLKTQSAARDDSAAATQAEIADALESLSRLRDTAAGRTGIENREPIDLAAAAALAASPPSMALSRRRPVALAAWHARAAAATLADGGLAPEREQKQALDAMRAAWDRAARQAATHRLEELPALSSLFQPFAPDEPVLLAGTWPRFGTRFREGFRAAAAAASGPAQHESDPAGYAEQLKAYFDALTQAQQGRR